MFHSTQFKGEKRSTEQEDKILMASFHDDHNVSLTFACLLLKLRRRSRSWDRDAFSVNLAFSHGYISLHDKKNSSMELAVI